MDNIRFAYPKFYQKHVQVVAKDYSYTGFVSSVFVKRSGQVRVVVEDEHGRLFIHNTDQLRIIAPEPTND